MPISRLNSIIGKYIGDIDAINPQSDIKVIFSNILNDYVNEVLGVFIEITNDSDYHPVLHYNCVFLGKKIIVTDNYVTTLHEGTPEASQYHRLRPNIDEQNGIHWGICFPNNKSRNIIFNQRPIDQIKNNIPIIFDNLRVGSETIDSYECLFPDFTNIDHKAADKDIKKIFSEIPEYATQLKSCLYGISKNEAILDTSEDALLNSLFEPAVVMGWKSCYTATFEDITWDSSKHSEFCNVFYICKKDDFINITEEYDKLQSFTELYKTSLRLFQWLEQRFLSKFYGIADTYLNVYKLMDKSIKSDKFDRYKTITSCNYEFQDNDFSYPFNLTTLIDNINGLSETFGYSDIFSINKLLNRKGLYRFVLIKKSSFESQDRICKLRSIYLNSREHDDLLRLNRILLESLFPKHVPPCNESIELQDYRSDITDILKGIYVFLDEALSKRGIWHILNLSSIFLGDRFNAIKLSDSSPVIVKQMQPNKLSWYGLFGSVNDNVVLSLVKDNNKLVHDLIIHERTAIDSIHEIGFDLFIPEGNGVITESDLNIYENADFVNKFKNSLLATILNINGTKRYYLLSNQCKSYLEKDDTTIINELFSTKNMSNWSDECLIYSNKYNIDYADSLEHFPNILFFKKDGKFTIDDRIICHYMNEIFVQAATDILTFESEILVGRLEDLVDNKPNRIFANLFDSHKPEHDINNINTELNYINKVYVSFNLFIRNQLQSTHPIIGNPIRQAYFIYWTKYFHDNAYLEIPPYINNKYIDVVNDWRKLLKDWTDSKPKGTVFNFKEYVFSTIGEKTVIEFEIIDCQKVKYYIEAENLLYDVCEFEKIYICDANVLIKHSKPDYFLYINYIKSKLLRLLDFMNAKDGSLKVSDIINHIGDGSKPVDYLSLFCRSDFVNGLQYKYIYYVPSAHYTGGSQGGFSFFCANKWPDSICKAAQDWATRFGTTFSEIEAKKLVAREITKHGTKAAMTAIMSRNLSHNIGSHVLSYWNQELSSKIKIDFSECSSHQKAIFRSRELFQYIQHRMDFLAEVSTSIPCSELSLDIENDILNPLFNSDSSVLLQFIANSEGIDLRNKVVIDTSGLNRKRVSIPNGLVGIHAIYSILENFIRNAVKHYKFSFPSDLVDAKNLLSIVIAKTSNISGDSKFNKFKTYCIGLHRRCTDTHIINTATNDLQRMIPFIKIIVEDADDIFINCNKWKQDYIVFKLFDMREQSCNHEIVEDLRSTLPGGNNYKYTNDSGDLAQGAWGIKEMITSANFLRKNKPDFVLNADGNLLDILCGDNTLNGSLKYQCEKSNGKHCGKSNSDYKNKLGIRFYLRKPKDLFINASLTTRGNSDLFQIDSPDTHSYYIEDSAVKMEMPYRMLLVSKSEKELFEGYPQAPCRIVSHDSKNWDDIKVTDDLFLNKYEEFVRNEIYQSNDDFPKLLTNIDQKFRFSGDDNYTAKFSYNEDKTIRSNKIVFENHPETLTDKNTFDTYLNQSDYFQPISGGYSTKAKLCSIKMLSNNLLKKCFYLELLEAALTRVIIIDERISELSNKKYHFDSKIRDILFKMKIHVLEINLNNISYADLHNKLTDSADGFKVFDADPKKQAHFFIIHQGILDKLPKECKAELMSTVKCKWKVVDSGRGVPSGLLEDVRFVEISSLQKMIENYDKHGLVQTLFSLRRPPSI